MEKLPMCRICLAANVGMFKVVNRNLHKLYEKLTNIPFLTEDRRPMLACFFCCAKLKQCYRLLRQCLEAEKLFAQMMNEDYEHNPFMYQDSLEFFSGFIKSPIVHISIDDECETESMAIKDELPAMCDGLDDIIEPKEEHQGDEPELDNLDNRCLDVANITLQLHNSESEVEDDSHLMEFKIEVEEEVSKNKRTDRKAKKEYLDNICLDVADIPPHHSESDSEDDVPLVELKTEVEEVSKKKRTARETIRPTTVTKKAKLNTRKTKVEDAITVKQSKEDKSDLKVIPATQKWRSKPGTDFNVPYKMIQDTLTQIGEKPYKCDVCPRSFKIKSALTYHIRIHTGEKPYKCDVCPRSFKIKSALTYHIRIHTGEKPYKCDVCLRSFKIKSALTYHNLIHTGEKPFKCDICHSSFRHRRTLQKHNRIHTGEKPYKCDVCQRSFREHGNLKTHFRIHSGEKPYNCDVCQRSFSYRSNLTEHMRIHTSEKPFKCDICERSFRHKIALTKHMSIHTGEKPYKCHVCQRSFRVQGNLTQHVSIHTGEKPFKCYVCQRSFRRKLHLNNHRRKHTGEKPSKSM